MDGEICRWIFCPAAAHLTSGLPELIGGNKYKCTTFVNLILMN